jgi:hypothetical protein
MAGLAKREALGYPRSGPAARNSHMRFRERPRRAVERSPRTRVRDQVPGFATPLPRPTDLRCRPYNPLSCIARLPAAGGA